MADKDYSLITIEEVIKGQDWLEEIGKDAADSSKMFEKVISAIMCPKEYIELFEVLIDNMGQTLQRRFRRDKVRAYGFGSFVTGLCLKNCDLDLYIDIWPRPSNVAVMLKMIRKTLYNDWGTEFSRIFCIGAKVPILRCHHSSVGFECDISINNELARINSNLIKFYVDLNKSFHTFIMCLKLWSKRHDLSGPHYITSYSLVLLAIFFLQQMKYVPSLLELQTHGTNRGPRIINGWDSSFSTDLKSFQNFPEPLLVLTLLQEFFSFYSEFEFGHYIISLYVGDKILKPFTEPPNEFDLYKKQPNVFDAKNYVCLQDPFDHSFNTARNISRKTYVNFQTWCKTASEICSQESNEHLLKNLFTTYEKGDRKRAHEEDWFSVIVTTGKAVLSGDSEEEQRKAWVDCVHETLERILTQVLMGEVERKDNLYSCLFRYRVFILKTRTKVQQEKKIADEIQGLERLELVSKAVMELPPPERDLQKPVLASIKVDVLTKPSRMVLHFLTDDLPSYQQGFRENALKFLTGWIENALEAKF